MAVVNFAALRIREGYRTGFYDGLIIAGARMTGSVNLYSEDLRHGQVIDGALAIQSPDLPVLSTQQAGTQGSDLTLAKSMCGNAALVLRRTKAADARAYAKTAYILRVIRQALHSNGC